MCASARHLPHSSTLSHVPTLCRFMRKILIPLVPSAELKFSLELRGDHRAVMSARNKEDLVELMADVQSPPTVSTVETHALTM